MLMSIPGVLTPEELEQVRALIAEAGEDFIDGARTAGKQARQVKKNEQLPGSSEQRTRIQKICTAAMERNYRFHIAAWPKHYGQPMVSRYQVGMTYGDHVDEWQINKHRADVSVTLFISDPADYDGGELVINTPFGWQKIKLAAGNAITYPSTTLHRVDPVTRGTRLAVVTWIESFIRDERRREIMYDLETMRQRLVRAQPNGEDARIINKTYNNLMRMWTE